MCYPYFVNSREVAFSIPGVKDLTAISEPTAHVLAINTFYHVLNQVGQWLIG